MPSPSYPGSPGDPDPADQPSSGRPAGDPGRPQQPAPWPYQPPAPLPPSPQPHAPQRYPQQPYPGQPYPQSAPHPGQPYPPHFTPGQQQHPPRHPPPQPQRYPQRQPYSTGQQPPPGTQPFYGQPYQPGLPPSQWSASGPSYPPPAAPVPPRRSRTAGWLVGGLIGGLVIILAALWVPILRTRPNLGAAPVPTTSPTRASTPSPTGKPPKTPTKKPTPEPSKKPTKKPIPEPNRSLTSNTLYDIDLGNKSAKCSIKVIASRPVPKNSALKPYINDLVDCYTKVLKGPLAERGFTLTRPKVKTYKGKIETPCGEVGQDGSPAYYCPSNRTIYYPVTADDRNGWYANSRLHYVGLTGHEFGHHLQEVTGLDTGYGSLWQSASKKERLELTRRMELQAQCLEGVTLRYLRKSIKLSERDRAQLRQWHAYTGDEDPPKSRVPDHGTSKAQITWLERGMDSGDFGTCNTWTASPKKVK